MSVILYAFLISRTIALKTYINIVTYFVMFNVFHQDFIPYIIDKMFFHYNIPIRTAAPKKVTVSKQHCRREKRKMGRGFFLSSLCD